jgi:hypothetical protein
VTFHTYNNVLCSNPLCFFFFLVVLGFKLRGIALQNQVL